MLRVPSFFVFSHNYHLHSKNSFHTTSLKMSFSNADTGSKPADPYKEKNREEPGLKEKISDLGAYVDRTKFCLLTTKTNDGLLATRAMAVAGKENNGADFIFHTNTESGKTDDIEANSQVNLGFINAYGEWASISGTASIVTDRDAVHKHYSPSLKAWLGDLGDGKHDGGPNDPRIGLIQVKSKSVQYAVSRKTQIGQAFEVAKGVITGDAAEVNKLRHISESELQQVRSG